MKPTAQVSACLGLVRQGHNAALASKHSPAWRRPGTLMREATLQNRRLTAEVSCRPATCRLKTACSQPRRLNRNTMAGSSSSCASAAIAWMTTTKSQQQNQGIGGLLQSLPPGCNCAQRTERHMLVRGGPDIKPYQAITSGSGGSARLSVPPAAPSSSMPASSASSSRFLQ